MTDEVMMEHKKKIQSMDDTKAVKRREFFRSRNPKRKSQGCPLDSQHVTLQSAWLSLVSQLSEDQFQSFQSSSVERKETHVSDTAQQLC